MRFTVFVFAFAVGVAAAAAFYRFAVGEAPPVWVWLMWLAGGAVGSIGGHLRASRRR